MKVIFLDKLIFLDTHAYLLLWKTKYVKQNDKI